MPADELRETHMTRTTLMKLVATTLMGLLPLALTARAEEAPEPVPAVNVPGADPSAPVVGAYYYPWYGDGWSPSRRWNRAMRLRLEPPQEPKLGRYHSRDPEVVADHIAQSTRGGIGFWAVSWWGPGTYTDRTLKDHILEHKDAPQLRYAILYESTGRMGRFDRPDYRLYAGD